MSLVEAMISIVLMSIVGLGLAYALAKSSIAQRNMNVQNQIISKLRAYIQSDTQDASLHSGIYYECASSGNKTTTLTISGMPDDATIQKKCTIANVQISAAGQTKTVTTPVVEYSVTSVSYLGSGNQLKLTN